MPNPQTIRIPADQLQGWEVVQNAPPVAAGRGSNPHGAPGASFSGLVSDVGDVGTGVVKGAGQTAFGLGDLVHRTPVLGSITDALAKMVGPEGTDPNAAFSQQPDVLNADNGAQHLGKVAEQVGEFFIPAGLAREAAVKGLVRLIPNSASPGMMSVLNKAGAIIGRTVGEAGSAAAVSDLHGDTHPGESASIAAGSSLLGSGLSATAPLIKSPIAQQVLPTLMAILGMKTAGGLTPGGVGAGLGMFSVARAMAQHLVQNPKAVPTVAKGLRLGVPAVGRGIAGARSASETEQGR